MGKFSPSKIVVHVPSVIKEPFNIPTPGCKLRTWTVRDNYKRYTAAAAEPERRALKYIQYNSTLPTAVRLQAQMKLATMPGNVRTTGVKNRCIETGKSRGVISKLKLCRYQLKYLADRGELPGIKRASW
ncbi:mitochondrial 37S ribosomal uS14m domain-containing protein [Lipomyces oligophaga]|uniref:mitochondrial 37S ribosomal uS14m domain-containing protein n=1 Tax=Lipomyces oligophaga TaxID=45792 RepID=UPI0034CFDCAA